MLKQEPNTKITKTIIHIPATKRCFAFNESFTNPSSNSTGFSFQTPFESLKNQIHDIKPSLELRPQKSGFTRVFSNDEEIIENFKHQIVVPQIISEDTERFQVEFQKIIQLLAREESQKMKQQKQLNFNTKNILRNICNAQNQYILFNCSANKIIESHLSNPQKFKAWVNRLRFHTFEQFQRMWDRKQRGIFSKLYRKLCRQFYIENTIPYIMNSRIKNKQTKLTHIRYLYRFLQGLQNPSDFFYFKQKDKESV